MSPVKKSGNGAGMELPKARRPFVIGSKAIPYGKLCLPGDKSIAHRAVILSSLSAGKTLLDNFPIHQDSLATIEAFRKLGIKITRKSRKLCICAKGLRGLSKPSSPIFVRNSGTTMRLLLGVLAGQDFQSRLIAGRYLSQRPMLRVNKPLRMMGAVLQARRAGKEEYPPLVISGGSLRGISYKMPVASAQVKGAILLAALFAKGVTRVIEPVATRDHTERMLASFGAKVRVSKKSITVHQAQELVSPGKIYIPGDISSAAFFMVLACIIPGARIKIKGVGLNPTRCGILTMLKRMQAEIEVSEERRAYAFEPVGRVLVKSSRLKAAVISEKETPALIDEIPVLMVAACFAEGRSIFKGVGELRVKETDRIRSMSVNLSKMGGDIRLVKTGQREDIVVNGVGRLQGAKVRSFGDHRTAMSMVVAGLAADGKTVLDDLSCIDKSYPGFIKDLNCLLRRRHNK